jgi:hypothetical protein
MLFIMILNTEKCNLDFEYEIRATILKNTFSRQVLLVENEKYTTGN